MPVNIVLLLKIFIELKNFITQCWQINVLIKIAHNCTIIATPIATIMKLFS